MVEGGKTIESGAKEVENTPRMSGIERFDIRKHAMDMAGIEEVDDATRGIRQTRYAIMRCKYGVSG